MFDAQELRTVGAGEELGFADEESSDPRLTLLPGGAVFGWRTTPDDDDTDWDAGGPLVHGDDDDDDFFPGDDPDDDDEFDPSDDDPGV